MDRVITTVTPALGTRLEKESHHQLHTTLGQKVRHSLKKTKPKDFISDILKIIFYYSFTFHELTWNWLCRLQKAEFATPLLQYVQ